MGIKTDNPCNMMCLNIQFQFVNYVMLEMCWLGQVSVVVGL
jgi:hypothetical protein